MSGAGEAQSVWSFLQRTRSVSSEATQAVRPPRSPGAARLWIERVDDRIVPPVLQGTGYVFTLELAARYE